MAVELFQCAPVELSDALVVIASGTNAWKQPYAEGFVLRTRRAVRVHRIFVYREAQEDSSDAVVFEALDARAYASEWCKATLENQLLNQVRVNSPSVTHVTSVDLAEVFIPFLFRRWRTRDGELALRRMSIESVSDELKALVRDLLWMRGLYVETSDFGPPDA